MSLPAASFEPVISYLNLASPGAEIRSGKTGNSASLRRSGHTTSEDPEATMTLLAKFDVNNLLENEQFLMMSSEGWQRV